jgi:hypothetical protein
MYLMNDQFFVPDEEDDLIGHRKHKEAHVAGWEDGSIQIYKACSLHWLGREIPEGDGNIIFVISELPTREFPWQEYCGLPTQDANGNILPMGLQAILHNWDGAYWEIFSHNLYDYDILRDAHRSHKGLDMKLVSFSKDFPRPTVPYNMLPPA